MNPKGNISLILCINQSAYLRTRKTTIVLIIMAIKFQINNNGKQPLIAFIIALIRSFMPLIYRIVKKDRNDFQAHEVVVMVAMIVNNLFGFFISFIFLLFYIRDMKLKYFVMNQCKLILQLKKYNETENKILPTIDITNIFSLKGWSILRRVCLDYGKQFGLRLQAYMGIYLFYIIFDASLLVLWVLKIYELDNLFPFLCLFEIIATFSLLFYTLFLGSLVNEFFPTFQNTLNDHRVLFQDMIRMKNIYFNEKIQKQLTNVVIRKTVQKLKQQLQITDEINKNKEEEISQYLNELLTGISDCECELEQDSKNQPFSLYGIKITLSIVQQIAITVATLGVGFIQLYLLTSNTVSLAPIQSK